MSGDSEARKSGSLVWFSVLSIFRGKAEISRALCILCLSASWVPHWSLKEQKQNCSEGKHSLCREPNKSRSPEFKCHRTACRIPFSSLTLLADFFLVSALSPASALLPLFIFLFT